MWQDVISMVEANVDPSPAPFQPGQPSMPLSSESPDADHPLAHAGVNPNKTGNVATSGKSAKPLASH